MNWKNGNEGSAAVDLKPRDPPGSVQINNCLHSTANSNYTGSTRRTAETATGSDRRRPDDRKGTCQNNIPAHSSKYSTRLIYTWLIYVQYKYKVDNEISLFEVGSPDQLNMNTV